MGNALAGAVRPKATKARPWRGAGAGVFEMVDDHDGDTFRGACTVRFKEVVHVLHAFQKKSRNGIKTA